MELPSLKQILSSTVEKIDELRAGPRARKIKAQAEQERADIELKIVVLKEEIAEMFSDKEKLKKEGINFEVLFQKLDKIALLERRDEQYAEVLTQLFADEAPAAA